MEFSENGMTLLENLEGFRGKPYADSGGKMTVGYGHLIVPGDGVCLGDIIGPCKGSELLALDVKIAVDGVNKSVTKSINQNQFDALVIFAFNVGVYAFKTPTLLRLLNLGDVTGACNQFLRWDMAGGVHVPGLRKRRVAEQALFLTPEDQ